MIRPGQAMVEVGRVGMKDFKPFHHDCGIRYHHRMDWLELQMDMHRQMSLALREDYQYQARMNRNRKKVS